MTTRTTVKAAEAMGLNLTSIAKRPSDAILGSSSSALTEACMREAPKDTVAPESSGRMSTVTCRVSKSVLPSVLVSNLTRSCARRHSTLCQSANMLNVRSQFQYDTQ
jgi:hypothetical protein